MVFDSDETTWVHKTGWVVMVSVATAFFVPALIDSACNSWHDMQAEHAASAKAEQRAAEDAQRVADYRARLESEHAFYCKVSVQNNDLSTFTANHCK